MNIGRKITTAAIALTLGFGFSGRASAQDPNLRLHAKLSYGSTDRNTWNTVLLVSGAVLVVGLIQEESTLTILGGAGVLLSLFETNKTNFRSQYFPHGLDLYKTGPVSFGVSAFSSMGLTEGFRPVRPAAYISATFKF